MDPLAAPVALGRAAVVLDKDKKQMELDTVIDIIPEERELQPRIDGVDGRTGGRNFWSRLVPGALAKEEKRDESFASKKTAAEGMMDIALLTANANQLRFLFAYNSESSTYYMSVALIIGSLVLQILVGVMLIFKRQMKNKGKSASWTNDFIVVGVFLITVINVFAASFTMTHGPGNSAAHNSHPPQPHIPPY